MFQVDEKPETIHLYVVREEVARPSLLPIFLSVFVFLCVVAVGVLSPYQEPVTRVVLRVPAVLLPMQTFRAQTSIIPTGIRTYPATTATGVLTITNGSVISQTLPKGLIFTGKDSVEVVTDAPVFVPAGSAAGYGVATVSASTVISGKDGNISAYDIDAVEGSSIYIRNLSSFQGGKDRLTIRYSTEEDSKSALEKARQLLLQQSVGLHYPCKENRFPDATKMVVTWQCQFVTYHIPAFYHVTGVRLIGKNLILEVIYIERPKHFWVK